MAMWKKFGKSWEKFTGEKLNKPGTLVTVCELGHQTACNYLIGDINKERGVCDDCTNFGTDAIVVRYREFVRRTWDKPVTLKNRLGTPEPRRRRLSEAEIKSLIVCPST